MSTQLPSYFCQIRGADQNGPNVLIMGGVHGNEKTGIELVKRLLKALGLQVGRPSGVHDRSDVIGNLFIGIGNPEAIVKNKRGASEVRDLNRSFCTTDLIDENQQWSDLVRARELAPLLEQIDYLFDIHATGTDSPPFVCFGKDDELHRKIYERVPVEFVLTDPDLVLPTDVGLNELSTTDYYVDTFGGSDWGKRVLGRERGVAICYETGQQDDMSRVDQVEKTILQLLQQVGSVTPKFISAIGKSAADHPVKIPKVFALSSCVVAKALGFQYAKGMDLAWQEVKKGAVLGVYPDGTKELIPEDGMLLFQRKPDQIKVGRKLFYMARRIR